MVEHKARQGCRKGDAQYGNRLGSPDRPCLGLLIDGLAAAYLAAEESEGVPARMWERRRDRLYIKGGAPDKNPFPIQDSTPHHRCRCCVAPQASPHIFMIQSKCVKKDNVVLRSTGVKECRDGRPL